MLSGLPLVAADQMDAKRIVSDALTAMGGADKVMSVKTLVVEAGGHWFDPDQGYRWDELGLQSDVTQMRDVKHSYDLVNQRVRFEATHQKVYPFFQGNSAVRQISGFDGKVAYSFAPDGDVNRLNALFPFANRFDYFRHPLPLMRAASMGALSNPRAEGNEYLVDLNAGDPGPLTLTIAFDMTTKLPSRVFRMADSQTMGDRKIETAFSEYKSVDGVQLPTRLVSKMDRFVNQDLRLLKQSINQEISGDLSAPPNAVIPAVFQLPGGPTTLEELAPGIWMVGGTIQQSFLVEFSDHLLMVEAYSPERTQVVMAKAKEVRPNKPVTQLIMTHHHSDHSGGVRTAVAMGVKEVIAQKENVAFLNEMFKRPHGINPDLYSKTAGIKPPKITAIDDTGIIKDGTRTINLYHLLDNGHADTQLLTYFPQGRILVEADDYMPEDARNIMRGEPLGHAPWNVNLLANVNFRKLQIDKIAPVHGAVVPYSRFLENAILVTQNLPSEDKK